MLKHQVATVVAILCLAYLQLPAAVSVPKADQETPATRALNKVETWKQLHDALKRYPDSGTENDDAYVSTAVYLLAHKWNTTDSLQDLIRRDPAFGKFVLDCFNPKKKYSIPDLRRVVMLAKRPGTKKTRALRSEIETAAASTYQKLNSGEILSYKQSLVETWKQLRDFTRRYPNHDYDGETGEGYSDFVVKTLATHWSTLPKLRQLMEGDPKFARFVIGHIEATTDEGQLKTDLRLARKPGTKETLRLRRKIAAAAKWALADMKAVETPPKKP